MAARRAELHQRAPARALAQRDADTERRRQATERALEGEREARRATEWEKQEAERERARWYAASFELQTADVRLTLKDSSGETFSVDLLSTVHLADETAAAAWLVSEDDDHE